MPDKKIPLIGQLALRHKLITSSDLDKALENIKGSDNLNQALYEYLEKNKLISPLNMKRLKVAAKATAFRQKDLAFGNIAIIEGYLTPSLLTMALDQQKTELLRHKRSRLLGDILVEAGMLTPGQRDKILKKQKRLKALARLHETESGKLPRKPPEKKPSQIQDAAPQANQEITEIFQGGIKLTIASDFLTAHLSKTDDFDNNITLADIKEILTKKEIVFGIVDDTLIQGFIRSRGFKTKPFRVASGIDAVKGKNAEIKYFFDTDHLKAGRITSEGGIDFRERGEIPQVEQGVVLARKIPRKEEKPGKNIFGEIIAVPPATNVKLKYGKGVKLSRDGLELTATINGQPYLAWNGMITVLEDFTTKGDVNYETGHIDYKGNIKVKGCIQNGFKVTGNNIRTREIDGGIIHADGDVSVSGGIRNAIIYARGNIWAKFIHKSEITCMGDIYVTKEIVESTLESSGGCVIKKGKIISSEISAKSGVFVRNLGTDVSKPGTIKVGVDIFILKELTRIKEDLDKTRQDMAELKVQKKELEEQARKKQEEATRLAYRQDRSNLEQKSAISKIASLDKVQDLDKIKDLKAGLSKLKQESSGIGEKVDTCFDELDTLDHKIKEATEKITLLSETLTNLLAERRNLGAWSKKNPGQAILEVSGTIMPGTRVAGKNSETTIDRPMKNTTIKELFFTHPDGAQEKGWWEMRVVAK